MIACRSVRARFSTQPAGRFKQILVHGMCSDHQAEGRPETSPRATTSRQPCPLSFVPCTLNLTTLFPLPINGDGEGTKGSERPNSTGALAIHEVGLYVHQAHSGGEVGERPCQHLNTQSDSSCSGRMIIRPYKISVLCTLNFALRTLNPAPCTMCVDHPPPTGWKN